MVRPETRSRIEAAHRFSAFYRNGFANHLPMALVALDAMGADDGAIDRFIGKYTPQLESLGEPLRPIEEGREAAWLGKPEAFPAWVRYFEARIAESGVSTIVRDWLARLASGVGCHAFHGVIRLAYAIESGSEREIAHALAYWAAAFQSHGEVALAGPDSPADVLAARLDPARLDVDSLAAAMLRAYVSSGDFTMLHGVTGTHAFRVLMPFLHDGADALRHLWVSLVAAHVGAGAPRLDGWALAGDDALDWPDIHARAAGRDDEHDIKLVYSCWREWQARGDDLYRRAASARVGDG